MKKIEDTIKKESRPVALMTTKADGLALIKTDKDVVKATEFLVQVKRKIKSLETERQEYTKPINESLKKLNTRFKELTEPLKNAERVVKDAIVLYRQETEQKRLEKETQLRKDNGNENIELTNTLPEIVESKSGETRTTHRWTFEVTNKKKIPLDYMIIDEVKINDAIRNKVRKIPGLKIYQKEGISIH